MDSVHSSMAGPSTRVVVVPCGSIQPYLHSLATRVFNQSIDSGWGQRKGGGGVKKQGGGEVCVWGGGQERGGGGE